MTSADYQHYIQAIHFDGTNHGEVASAAMEYFEHTAPYSYNPYINHTTSGSTITIQTDQYYFTMYPDMVLIQDGYVVGTTNTLADFTKLYREPVTPTATLAVGYAVTPSLGVGASATVAVDMVPALPDSGYNVGVALAGSAQLLGALAILSATVVDADTVNVVIQNNGLLTLSGATVLVTALHNG